MLKVSTVRSYQERGLVYPLVPSFVSFIIYMFATIELKLFLILFMFLVIMFIVYFDYMLSIARLSLCSSISLYSACSGVHGVSGKHFVRMVLIRCLPVDAPYILGHMVDH